MSREDILRATGDELCDLVMKHWGKRIIRSTNESKKEGVEHGFWMCGENSIAAECVGDECIIDLITLEKAECKIREETGIDFTDALGHFHTHVPVFGKHKVIGANLLKPLEKVYHYPSEADYRNSSVRGIVGCTTYTKTGKMHCYPVPRGGVFGVAYDDFHEMQRYVGPKDKKYYQRLYRSARESKKRAKACEIDLRDYGYESSS